MATRSQVLKMLKGRLATVNETVEEFQKQLQGGDPTTAFEWADPIMRAAAELRPLRITIKNLEGDVPASGVTEVCLAEALMHAKFPRQSTSLCSNAMHAYEGAAWVEIHGHVKAIKE